MAGKNKVEKGFRITVNSQDLSGDLVPGSLTGGGVVFDKVEMTGVSDTVKNYLAGHGDAPINGKFYLNDTGTTGAFTVIEAANGTSVTVTLQYGSAGAAPTTGDPEWEGAYTIFMGQVGFDGGKAVFDCEMLPSSSTAPDWGTVS